MADHPVQGTASIGVAGGVWRIAVIVLGLAAVTVELFYRRQRRTREDVVRKVTKHRSVPANRWEDMDITRS